MNADVAALIIDSKSTLSLPDTLGTRISSIVHSFHWSHNVLCIQNQILQKIRDFYGKLYNLLLLTVDEVTKTLLFSYNSLYNELVQIEGFSFIHDLS